MKITLIYENIFKPVTAERGSLLCERAQMFVINKKKVMWGRKIVQKLCEVKKLYFEKYLMMLNIYVGCWKIEYQGQLLEGFDHRWTIYQERSHNYTGTLL